LRTALEGRGVVAHPKRTQRVGLLDLNATLREWRGRFVFIGPTPAAFSFARTQPPRSERTSKLRDPPAEAPKRRDLRVLFCGGREDLRGRPHYNRAGPPLFRIVGVCPVI